MKPSDPQCLGLNDHIASENLNLMHTFPFFGNQLYLVGCPSSPFWWVLEGRGEKENACFFTVEEAAQR